MTCSLFLRLDATFWWSSRSVRSGGIFRCRGRGCLVAGVFVVLVLVVVVIEVENELTDLSHLAVCAFPTGSNLLSDVRDSGV